MAAFAPKPKILILGVICLLVLIEIGLKAASWYSGDSYKPLWYLVPAFTLIGVALYLWVAKFQYLWPFKYLRKKHREESEERYK